MEDTLREKETYKAHKSRERYAKYLFRTIKIRGHGGGDYKISGG